MLTAILNRHGGYKTFSIDTENAVVLCLFFGAGEVLLNITHGPPINDAPDSGPLLAIYAIHPVGNVALVSIIEHKHDICAIIARFQQKYIPGIREFDFSDVV